MECPRCGEEITSGKGCVKCGKGTVASKKMEVQYKDFKVSELLDIRMTTHVPSSDEKEKPEPVSEKGAGSNRAAQADKGPSAQKALLIVTAVIAFLAAVAGFYLLRFLF